MQESSSPPVIDLDPGAALPDAVLATAERDPDARPHAFEDLVSVMLDPAGSWPDLGVLQLVAGDESPGPVEEDAAAARRALIDGGDERSRLHGSDYTPRLKRRAAVSRA